MKNNLLFRCIVGISFAFYVSASYAHKNANALPIVYYHEKYTPSLGHPIIDWVIQQCHPFDRKKYEKIYHYLIKTVGLKPEQFMKPALVSWDDLCIVHPDSYLKKLYGDSRSASLMISRAVDLAELLAVFPASWLQKGLLEPMRYATQGTIDAMHAALKHGWAINIGGGYHHAKRAAAQGGCIFGDIQLAVEKFWQLPGNENKHVLIIDLDAHQGNGYGDYFKESFNTTDRKVHIFDMYNKNEMPSFGINADQTQQYIDKNMPLEGGKLAYGIGIGSYKVPLNAVDHFCVTEHVENRAVYDNEYLQKLKIELPLFIDQLIKEDKKPSLIIFNAGTDIFENDFWGCMQVSKEGIIERDRFVFEQAHMHAIPIVLLLSGGYSAESAGIVAESIENILKMKQVHPAQRKRVPFLQSKSEMVNGMNLCNTNN